MLDEVLFLILKIIFINQFDAILLQSFTYRLNIYNYHIFLFYESLNVIFYDQNIHDIQVMIIELSDVKYNSLFTFGNVILQ